MLRIVGRSLGPTRTPAESVPVRATARKYRRSPNSDLALSADQMMSACSVGNPGKTTMTATMLEQSPDLWPQREDGKSVLDTIRKTLDTAVQDDPANGVYRVSRDIFTDPQIFEIEMKHIFEGNWIYLAHES